MTWQKKSMQRIEIMLRWIKRKIKQQKAYNELDRLTDRELNDMGISRSDIMYLVRNVQ